MTDKQYKQDDVFEIDYPFSIEERPLMFDSKKIKEWRPGCFCELHEDGGSDFYADGMGVMILTVISTHRPAKYPTRVFYIRQWKGPDGKVFGREDLKVISKGGFTGLLKGYRYDYILDTEELTND